MERTEDEQFNFIYERFTEQAGKIVRNRSINAETLIPVLNVNLNISLELCEDMINTGEATKDELYSFIGKLVLNKIQ